MANSMDALGAFTHLQTNLPLWVTQISELAAHTAKRHDEYTQAYRRHTTNKSANKPRRRKNSSVRSIHTDVIPIGQCETPIPEPTTVTPSTEKTFTENATTDTERSSHAPPSNQQAGRKRGPDESSIDSIEPYAFVSTRHNVIIEYDGHTQKTLEEMVKYIGIARNNIRRAKMSLMPRGNLRSSLLSRSANYANKQADSEESPLSILSTVRSTRTGAGLIGLSGSTGRKDSTFDFADQQLELAHGLCETAAFHVLRSGDCATELDGVEEKFKMLLEATNNEVTRLLEEKKREDQAREKKEKQAERERENLKQSLEPTTVHLTKLASITDKPSVTGTGPIEVDDTSSISAESIDLSAFRSSRIRV